MEVARQRVRRVHFGHDDARRFVDESIGADLESDRSNHGYVIATRPLSVHDWELFEPGELAVLEAGVLCFSTQHTASLARTLL